MDESPAPANRDVVYCLRWTLHLILLTLYPLALGMIGYFAHQQVEQPILPTGNAGLLVTAGGELVIFGAIFALACAASRPGKDALLLGWRDGSRPVWRGFGYSVLLRAVLVIFTVLLALVVSIVTRDANASRVLRPETENVVSPQALLDPLYLALTLTVISFVVAGLREELWRAGMLAGLAALFPQLFVSRASRLVSAAIVAVVFGLGHLTQGLGGVIVTTALGFGLGAIMLRYRSIWEAVFAHGFFNATTFGLLYLMARFRPDLLPESGF